MKQSILTLVILSALVTTSFAALHAPLPTYHEHNQADVSFDVSMPIDSTGYLLQGHNLTGGLIQFSDQGTVIGPLLTHETGSIQPPTVSNKHNIAMIQTRVDYDAIKFINPNGISNLFIKIGIGKRTQTVHGLDPAVLKDGSYSWFAPFFSIGREVDNHQHKGNSRQFIQVGSYHSGPASKNTMYTQDFYLYTKGSSTMPIMGQPIRSVHSGDVLKQNMQHQFSCYAVGLWGGGGADPYRSMTGTCKGNSLTLAAGPNLDYEYGSFSLPTVHSPWSASATDTCFFPNEKKPRKGCTNITIAIKFHYTARKIRVPISHRITLFAEAGTAIRHITPTNLRYQCKTNVYLKGILAKADCLKKSYLPGSASYPYFAVGFDVTQDGKHYEARYINLPGAENQNRLAWLDASNTDIYATSTPNNHLDKTALAVLKQALNIIKQKYPAVYQVLGPYYFANTLKQKAND